MRIHIRISRDGRARFIYADALCALIARGTVVAGGRASDVEPIVEGGRIRWAADMAKVRGPVLPPTDTREESLAAERTWLLAHKIPVPA